MEPGPDRHAWQAVLASRRRPLRTRDHVLAQLARAHTSVDEVGSIAERAGVATLVPSHLVPADAAHTTDEWEAMVQPRFPSGKVICGVDLDELPIGGGSAHG